MWPFNYLDFIRTHSLRLLRHISGPTIFALTLVIAPLLAFSESTIKSILDRWLSQCIVVIDSSQKPKEAPIFRVYAFGEMPNSLPLTFSADEGEIKRISMINHVEQETTKTEANLLVHPLANQRCPGDLCPEQLSTAEKLTIRVSPISSNYLYQFRVITSEWLPDERIKAYVRPLQGEDVQCRVERATVANFVARQSKLIQLALLFLAVVVFGLLLNYLKLWRGKTE